MGIIESLKNLIRKIIPLRAVTFARYRKEQKKLQSQQHKELVSLIKKNERQRKRDFERTMALLITLRNEIAQVRDDVRKNKESCLKLAQAQNDLKKNYQDSLIKNRMNHQRVSRYLKANNAKLEATKSLVFKNSLILKDLSGDQETIEAIFNQSILPVGALPDEREKGTDKDPELIVSLTSYPARISTVHKTIESLLNQTKKPDAVLLWLSYEEFPLMEAELPPQLLALREKGLTIRWCDNLGSHKKYYYTMYENPDATVITFDDDVLYSEDAVAILCEASKKHPQTVCARRARRIAYDEDGDIAPYAKWDLSDEVDVPSIDLMATGVGGVLYPPHIMSDKLFDKEMLLRICPDCDDLWLKTMQVLVDTPTVLSDTRFELVPVEDTQDTSLYIVNQLGKQNDRILKDIRETFKGFGNDIWKRSE